MRRKETYKFCYAPMGGKSTKGRNGWYLLDKDAPPKKEAVKETEVDKLLHDEQFQLLRDALKNEHVTTIEQLKTIKLWPFMKTWISPQSKR